MMMIRPLFRPCQQRIRCAAISMLTKQQQQHQQQQLIFTSSSPIPKLRTISTTTSSSTATQTLTSAPSTTSSSSTSSSSSSKTEEDIDLACIRSAIKFVMEEQQRHYQQQRSSNNDDNGNNNNNVAANGMEKVGMKEEEYQQRLLKFQSLFEEARQCIQDCIESINTPNFIEETQMARHAVEVTCSAYSDLINDLEYEESDLAESSSKRQSMDVKRIMGVKIGQLRSSLADIINNTNTGTTTTTTTASTTS